MKGSSAPLQFESFCEFMELENAIPQILNVATPRVQERRMIPFAVFGHVCFVDGDNNFSVIRLKDVQPYLAFSNAFEFFHFYHLVERVFLARSQDTFVPEREKKALGFMLVCHRRPRKGERFKLGFCD